MESKTLYCMECVEGRPVALGLCADCLAGEPLEEVIRQIARLSRELENARTRLAHIEREVARLVDAEVISEGKAREILDVGVDEWREIMERSGDKNVTLVDVLLYDAGREHGRIESKEEIERLRGELEKLRQENEQLRREIQARGNV